MIKIKQVKICSLSPNLENTHVGGYHCGGYIVPLKGPYSTPPGAKVSTKNHHKTMKIKVPEAEILRTPIKIEKLSVWSVTLSEFIMNFEFH